MRTKFFASAPDRFICHHSPTILNTPVVDDNGENIVELRDIDTIDDSIKNLKYTDFEIQNLLKAGVSLKSLAIHSDNRLGVTDDMINDYNERLASIADLMFNVDKK